MSRPLALRSRSKKARAIAKRRRRRGMALILVLAALTVLTVMLTEIQDESSAEFGSALSARDALVAEYAAKSAVNLSRLLIAAEPTIRRSLTLVFALVGGSRQVPVWAYADRILGAFNDLDGADSFTALAGVNPKLGKNLGFKGAGFRLEIVDEDSKINFNVAARGDAFSQTRLASQIVGLIKAPQYSPLFEGRDADEQYSDRRAICSAIIDWVDPDQDQALCDPTSTTAQQAAAEDSFYQLLNKPYKRKNAAFDSLEELHMVRGIGDDFWSTFIDPDPDKPEKRIVTIWGQGAVNVNTANPQTLLAVVCQASNNLARMCLDAVEAQKFIMAMTMLRSFMPGLPVFKNAQEFVSALQQTNQQAGAPAAGATPAPGGLPGMGGGGSPIAMIMKAMQIEPIPIVSAAETAKMVTTESKVFSIYATGYVRSGQRESRVRVHAVVDFRGAPSPQQQLNDLVARLGQAASGQPGLPPTANSATNPTGQPPGTQGGLPNALKPGPGGNVVYYRVD
ncbi:MAG TPA: type II secretion system protein GspK [Polyangiaceae bacterium]|nr:type II secretion system protein GspK [Polyangiaceae bacterium]